MMTVLRMVNEPMNTETVILVCGCLVQGGRLYLCERCAGVKR